MDWKKYETEIYDTFRHTYPSANISFNQKIIGRYSKTERQIDVLVEGRIAGVKIRLVIDAKHYSQKIDVKHVETFISMVEDIDAAQGILITSQGYTPAAINRAYYGPTSIELDILNFDDLKQFQGFMGIPRAGRHGAMLPAPFGWIIDGTKREHTLAYLYQRGKTFEEATESGEFIYVNILSYDDSIENLDTLLKLQENETKEFHPDARFEYLDTVSRENGLKTAMRKIIRTEFALEEYTGFVSNDECCIFCVLFTPLELKVKNIRKLEYCIERLIPIKINLESVADIEISQRRLLFDKSTDDEEKAQILISIARIYRNIKKTDMAIEEYEQSIKFFPSAYEAHLGLLEIGFNTDQRIELVNTFYSLSPGNRQLCDDLVRISVENDSVDFMSKFFEAEQSKERNDEILGTLYFSHGDLYFTIGNYEKAKFLLTQSRAYFLNNSATHDAIQEIDKALEFISTTE